MVLDGIRVLDVTRFVAGPICSALMADFGADVIRIEPPGGGEDRTALPIAEGFHGGVGFTQVNRNKRGLTLDLSVEEGRAIFAKLVKTADIVVANLPAKSAASLGLSYEALAALRKDVIFVHLTAFGADGPLAARLGFDAIAQVMSGLTHLSGEAGKPMKSAAAWVDMATGFIGAFGAMAALRHRDATGEGQLVEANLMRTALTVGNYFLIEQALNGADRQGVGNMAPSGAPADLVRAKDGWLYVVALGDSMFARWARLVGREDLLSDSRFASDESRAAHGKILSEIAGAWASQRTMQEAIAELARHKIPVGELLSPRQVLENDAIREYFKDVAVDGLTRPVPYVTPPVTLRKTPARIERGPPRPGADNVALLSEIGFSAEDVAALAARGVI